MDEWVVDGKAVGLHFPSEDPTAYIASWDRARCVVMQGGQGETKHWGSWSEIKADKPDFHRPEYFGSPIFS